MKSESPCRYALQKEVGFKQTVQGIGGNAEREKEHNKSKMIIRLKASQEEWQLSTMKGMDEKWSNLGQK